MAGVLLQEMVSDIRFDDPSANQDTAVQNVIRALWKYEEDFVDYQANETAEANRERKQKFSGSTGPPGWKGVIAQKVRGHCEARSDRSNLKDAMRMSIQTRGDRLQRPAAFRELDSSV